MGRKKKSERERQRERESLAELVLSKLGRKMFHEISIQELSKEAGISKGAFFLIFSSKAELLVFLICEYMENCFFEMDSALESRILAGVINDEVPVSERRDVVETAFFESFFPEQLGLLSLFSQVNVEIFSKTGKEGESLLDLLDNGFNNLIPKIQLFLPEISEEMIKMLCHQVFNLLVLISAMGFSQQHSVNEQKRPFGFSHTAECEFRKQLSLLFGGYGN